jgi:hypothetical protein
LAFVSVIVCPLIGLLVKIGTGGFMAHETVLDWPKLTSGEKIGPFTFDRLVNDDQQYWQLRSGQCEGPILMTASSIKEATNTEYIEVHHPATKWRTLYVYRGQASNTFDTFARISSLTRFLLLQLKTEIALSSYDGSDEFFFSFLVPVDCTLDENSAVAASEALSDALGNDPNREGYGLTIPLTLQAAADDVIE